HAEWMAESDRAAVDIDLLGVETQLADHDEALGGERLVQLDEVHVLKRDAASLDELANGRDRPDAHHAWIDPGDSTAYERAEWLHAQLTRLLLGGDDESRRAVVDPGGIPGGDRPALAEGGLERGELLRGRVRTRVL